MNSSIDKKKRINVGTLAFVRDEGVVKILLDKWGQEVLHYNKESGDFVPHKVVVAENTEPPCYGFEDALNEAMDLVVEKCQFLCENVAVNLHSTLDSFADSISLSETARSDSDVLSTRAHKHQVNVDSDCQMDTQERILEYSGLGRSTPFKDILTVTSGEARIGDWEDLGLVGTTEKLHLKPFLPDESDIQELYILLVSSRSDPEKYILPKGGLHPGESACCGALRECWEESGVTGYCEASIKIHQNGFQNEYFSHGNYKFETGLPGRDSKGRKISKWYWFSMNTKKIGTEWPEKEERHRIWIQVKDVEKFKPLREDARFVINCWIQSHALA